MLAIKLGNEKSLSNALIESAAGVQEANNVDTNSQKKKVVALVPVSYSLVNESFIVYNSQYSTIASSRSSCIHCDLPESKRTSKSCPVDCEW